MVSVMHIYFNVTYPATIEIQILSCNKGFTEGWGDEKEYLDTWMSDDWRAIRE